MDERPMTWDEVVARMVAERERAEAAEARCTALEQERATLTARCEALEQERDYWKAQVDEAKARFDRDLANFAAGYSQAVTDATQVKP